MTKKTGIRQKPSGAWEARYYDPSGKLRGKSFKRKSDAQAFLNAVKTDIRRDSWLDPAKGKATFDELVDLWRATAADLERTTRDQHETALRTWLLPRFATRQVASISDFDVRQLKAELLEAGRAPATATKYLEILAKILQLAVANGYIARNPCTGVSKAGEQPVEETIFLTAEELNALADEMEPRFGPMALLAGYRGFRFGECAGLRPARVDLLRAKIDLFEVLKESNGNLYFGLPKHKRRRSVTLLPFLTEALEAHLAAFPPRNDLVFTNPDGSMLRRSNFDRRVWQPAVKRAGLDPRLTFHGLRHTAVSILIAEGAQTVELAAIMGWARSTAVAMELRYGHLFRAREEHLTNAVEEAYRRARKAAEGQMPGSVAHLPQA